MELKHYLLLVRKWLWLIVLGAGIGAVSAFVFSVMSTPIYQATMTMMISQGADPYRDQNSAVFATQRLASTYVEQIRSRAVMEQVVHDLNLPLPPNALIGMTSAQAVRDTQLIRVSVEDENPARAQAIANQIGVVFNQQLNEYQQSRFKNAQEELDRQVAETKKKIDETQKALAPLGDANDPKNLSAPEFVRTERLRLQMELSTLQNQYAVLVRSANDFRLASARYADTVTVSASAEMPIAPVRPRTSTNTLLGLAVGLMLAAGIAFLVEYLDDSVKSSDDVTRVLELSVLGNVVRFPKGTTNPLVALTSPRAPYVEAYRNLRTNLQFSMLVDSAAALVVSSAEPGEGKSTTVANLATVMAQMDKRVILVDTDLRRPTQHHIFNVPPEPGLTDVFLNELTLEQAITKTAVPNLDVLTAGKLPPNPAELIESPWMEKLIAILKTQYDVVLFDSPPVLPVTDAALLASKTKHLLWVVSAGKTRSDTLRRAREALKQVDAKILGVVLNRVAAGSGYGYYYYYYYAKDGDKKKHKRHSATQMAPAAPPISGNGNGSGNGRDKAERIAVPPETMPE